MTPTPHSQGTLLSRVVGPLAISAFALTAHAQYGGLDATFNTGQGPNTYVNVVALQPDGRILIGGSFTTVDAAALSRIARLNPNGSVDPSFEPGTGANSDVRAVAVQPDGRILIAGDFTTFYGAPRQRLARLQPDGTVDYSFNPPGGANDQVLDLALQTDGRIVVVGNFTVVGGVALNRIARLNPDGSVNTSFDPSTAANNIIRAVALQADGKIVIGGDFTSYAGQTRNRIARLNPDGSLDASFSPGTGMNSSVYDLVMDGNGGILAGGAFTLVNGKAQRGLARLISTGGSDPQFDTTVGFNNAVYRLALQPDGRIIAGGAFTTVNQINRARVARINTDASVDLTFDPAAGPNSTVLAVAAPQDGNVVIGGQFTTIAAQTRRYVARLTADGGSAAGSAPQIAVAPVDQKVHAGYSATFTVVASGSPPPKYQWKFKGAPISQGTNSTLHLTNILPEQDGDYVATLSSTAGSLDTPPVALTVLPSAPASGSVDLAFNTGTGPNNYVYAVALQPDGRILIGGAFTSVDGQGRGRVARLRTDGSVDATFAPTSGTSGDVYALALLANGRILIGGAFVTYNGAPRQHIARINTDGTLDTTFLPGVGADNSVNAVAGQTDGKIVIGGQFLNVGGVSRNHIARLNEDGTLDTDFNPPGGANNLVRAVLIQSDGKIVIGGDFTQVNGVDRLRIARLNADGSLDDSFQVGTGFNNYVTTLSRLRSGILAGGVFTSYGGTAARGLALLQTSSGAISPNFDTPVGLNNVPWALAVDADDNLLIGGDFTAAQNLTRNRVGRLYGQDGSVDLRFDPAAGPNSRVYAIAAQPDGMVIIGGQFTTVAGETRRYVARLNGDPQLVPPPFRLAIRNTDDGVRVDLYGERGFAYTVQRSQNLPQWQTWQTNVAGAGLESEVRLSDPTSKTQPAGFYRAVYP